VPELPEVETIVRQLRPQLTHQTLHRPRLHHKDVLRGVSAAGLLRTLRGNRIDAVSRRAKHIVIRLETGERLVIQPRMTGSLVIYDRRLTPDERRYAVLQVWLDGGGQLVYRDVRRLGTLSLLSPAAWTAYSNRIGPEPLAKGFTATQLARHCRVSRQAIKKVVMDQQRLAGVGNIYANEALFRARIDPSRPANQLVDADYRRLFRHVRAVLREAIRAKGTTVRDYRTGTGQPGSYQAVLRVYGRGNEPCLRCRTPLVATHAIDGRATTFCWRCQGCGT
jgi:formamidopyrimidine-DNA glycosylase